MLGLVGHSWQSARVRCRTGYSATPGPLHAVALGKTLAVPPSTFLLHTLSTGPRVLRFQKCCSLRTPRYRAAKQYAHQSAGSRRRDLAAILGMRHCACVCVHPCACACLYAGIERTPIMPISNGGKMSMKEIRLGMPRTVVLIAPHP